MKILLRATITAFVVYVSPVSTGAQEIQLQGQLIISKEPITDPVPNGPNVAYFSIRGNAAKQMFEKLKSAKTVKNACGEQGLTLKTQGKLQCSQKARVYSCDFGIRLTDGIAVTGFAC